MKARLGWMTLCTVVVTLLVGGTVFADSPVDGRAGRSEMRFLEGMIDHHQMALDMANDCIAKAETESVLTVCQNIINAQTAEIVLMQGWLLAWYNVEYTPVPMLNMSSETDSHDAMGNMTHGTATEEHNSHGGHGSSSAVAPRVDPPMTMGMFAGLNAVTGRDYEIAWLEAMIDHHDDALHMAERILSAAPETVGHDELRLLAQQIISDQTAEIAAMEQMITELGS